MDSSEATQNQIQAQSQQSLYCSLVQACSCRSVSHWSPYQDIGALKQYILQGGGKNYNRIYGLQRSFDATRNRIKKLQKFVQKNGKYLNYENNLEKLKIFVQRLEHLMKRQKDLLKEQFKKLKQEVEDIDKRTNRVLQLKGKVQVQDLTYDDVIRILQPQQQRILKQDQMNCQKSKVGYSLNQEASYQPVNFLALDYLRDGYFPRNQSWEEEVEFMREKYIFEANQEFTHGNFNDNKYFYNFSDQESNGRENEQIGQKKMQQQIDKLIGLNQGGPLERRPGQLRTPFHLQVFSENNKNCFLNEVDIKEKKAKRIRRTKTKTVKKNKKEMKMNFMEDTTEKVLGKIEADKNRESEARLKIMQALSQIIQQNKAREMQIQNESLQEQAKTEQKQYGQGRKEIGKGEVGLSTEYRVLSREQILERFIKQEISIVPDFKEIPSFYEFQCKLKVRFPNYEPKPINIDIIC